MSRRTALIAAVVTAGCVSLAAALALSSRNDGSSSLRLEQGVPTEASNTELRSFADGRSGAVYWAGSFPSERFELTETTRGTFVRYLPEEAEVGDRRSLYLTVATYAVPRAFAFATAAAKRPGAFDAQVPGGGIAVWYGARPTSVYLARAGSDRLVEVFDPEPRRARSLILSGRVRPVSGE